MIPNKEYTIKGLKELAGEQLNFRLTHVKIPKVKIIEIGEERTITRRSDNITMRAKDLIVDDGTDRAKITLFDSMIDDLTPVVGDEYKIWSCMYSKTTHPDGMFHDLSLGSVFPERKFTKLS